MLLGRRQNDEECRSTVEVEDGETERSARGFGQDGREGACRVPRVLKLDDRSLWEMAISKKSTSLSSVSYVQRGKS